MTCGLYRQWLSIMTRSVKKGYEKKSAVVVKYLEAVRKEMRFK
jgi:hypothetical protein